MHVDLNGKTALITGAAGAIGSSTAVELARNGAIVFINDIDENKGREVVSRVISAGGKAFFQQGDVTKKEDMRKFVYTALDRYGRADILINNVGFNVDEDGRKLIHEYDPVKWHKVVDICMDSLYFCSKFAIESMRKYQYGKIVNLGSIAGWEVPLRLQAPYCAAKAAIINLTKSMALEYLKYGININAVVPGSIMNKQIQSVIYKDTQKSESMARHLPAGKAGNAVDIAKAILFFSSDDSRYITGSVLAVDGGWTCGYTA